MSYVRVSELPAWSPEEDGLNLEFYVVDATNGRSESKKITLGHLIDAIQHIVIVPCGYCGQPTIANSPCDYCGATPKEINGADR